MDEIIKNTTYPRRWSFREFDFFSGGTGIKIKGDERVKSFLGAFITVIIYVLLGLSTGYYILQFLDETNPKIQYNRRQLPMPSEFRFPDSGMNFFFLVTNPSSKAGSTEDFYLTIDTLKKYYTATSNYQVSNYKIEGTVSVKTEIKRLNIELIPCNQTAWFNDPINQEILKQNLFTMFIIQNFGICPNMTPEVMIFGDDQTFNNGRYRFRLELCGVDQCANDYMNVLANSVEQSITIGAFTPSVENSDKANPWRGVVNMDNLVPIGMFLNTRATMSLKEVQIETDTGILISKNSLSRYAELNSIRRDYAASVGLGDPIPPSTTQFSVKSFTRKPPIFELRIISSRNSEVYSRSYVTILDLFGSIGGSIEFVVVMFAVFFNWLEVRFSDGRARCVAAKNLGLPKLIRPGLKSFGYNKHNPETKLLAEASEVIDELTDYTISLEQMSLDRLLVRFFIDHSIPEDIRLLIPTVSIIRDIVEMRTAHKHKLMYDVGKYVKNKFKGHKEQLEARERSARAAKINLQEVQQVAVFSLIQYLIPEAEKAAKDAELDAENKLVTFDDRQDQEVGLGGHRRKTFKPEQEPGNMEPKKEQSSAAMLLGEADFEDMIFREIPSERIDHSEMEGSRSLHNPKREGNQEEPSASKNDRTGEGDTKFASSPQTSLRRVNSIMKKELSSNGPKEMVTPDPKSEVGADQLFLQIGQTPYTKYLGVLPNGDLDLPDTLEPGSLLEAYFSVLMRVKDTQLIESETGKPKRKSDNFWRMREQIMQSVKDFAEILEVTDLTKIFEEDSREVDKLTRGLTWMQLPSLQRKQPKMIGTKTKEAGYLEVGSPGAPKNGMGPKLEPASELQSRVKPALPVNSTIGITEEGLALKSA